MEMKFSYCFPTMKYLVLDSQVHLLRTRIPEKLNMFDAR